MVRRSRAIQFCIATPVRESWNVVPGMQLGILPILVIQLCLGKFGAVCLVRTSVVTPVMVPIKAIMGVSRGPSFLKRCPCPLMGKGIEVFPQARFTSGSRYPRDHCSTQVGDRVQ